MRKKEEMLRVVNEKNYKEDINFREDLRLRSCARLGYEALTLRDFERPNEWVSACDTYSKLPCLHSNKVLRGIMHAQNVHFQTELDRKSVSVLSSKKERASANSWVGHCNKRR